MYVGQVNCVAEEVMEMLQKKAFELGYKWSDGTQKVLKKVKDGHPILIFEDNKTVHANSTKRTTYGKEMTIEDAVAFLTVKPFMAGDYEVTFNGKESITVNGITITKETVKEIVDCLQD